MAVTYGFYNSLNKDRVYNAEQMSAIFDGVITDGVFASIADHMMPVAGTGLQVIVKPGKCWFNHTWTLNDAELPLTIATADVSLTRIDAIVVEINSAASTRANTIKVVKGTPSANPTKPTMLATETLHQYALGYVKVTPGMTSVTADKIEVNVGKSTCPFVTSVLQQTDITDLFNQWDAEFNAWFENVQSQLSGNVAANLQRQIDEVKTANELNTANIAKIKKNYGLKIGDILTTSAINPGSEFVECNGQAVTYQSNMNLPIGASRLSITPSTAPYIAMKSDNECGLFYKNSSSDATTLYMTFVHDIKNGLCDTPVAINTTNRSISDYGGVYFNGMWVCAIDTGYYDLYIYTASDPQGPWTEKHISLRSKTEAGYLSNIRVVNGHAVIVWRASHDSNDTILFYTDDLSKSWSKNIIDSAYAYDGFDIGYYAGHYFLVNTPNNYNREYAVSYASDLNASVWSPLGNYFANDTGDLQYCQCYSCQSDGLYMFISGYKGYKILKITSFNPLNIEICYSETREGNNASDNVNINSTFGRCNGKWYLFYSYTPSMSDTMSGIIYMTDDLSKGIFGDNIKSYYSNVGHFNLRGYAEYDKIVIPTSFYIFTNALMQVPKIKTIGLHYFLKISDTK